MYVTDNLFSLRGEWDLEVKKIPLDQWVPWYTSLFSSIIIISLLMNIITFLVTYSLVSIQGIPGLRGEKGDPGRTGPEVKVITQRASQQIFSAKMCFFHSENAFSYMVNMLCRK